MKRKTDEKRNPNMAQAEQTKNDSPLHQCTTILFKPNFYIIYKVFKEKLFGM